MASIGSVRRCADDGKVSGLAAGLAHSWNVDPVLVRVAFVVLALSGGIGVLLYLAGWVMIPQEGRDTSHLDEAIPQTRRWPKELRVAIVIAVCLIGAGVLSSLAPFSLVAAVVLAAVWYFGHYKNRQQRPRDTQRQHAHGQHPVVGAAPEPDRPAGQERTEFFDYQGEPTPFTEAATAWQRRIVAAQRAAEARSADSEQRQPTEQPPSTPTTPSRPEVDEQRAAFLAEPDPIGLYGPTEPTASVERAAVRDLERRRSARRLSLITLVAIGLTMTGLGIASAFGAAIGTGTYLAATLLVIGLSLVAGTRYGRPPWMAFAAVLVALSLLATLFVNPGPGEYGYRELRYTGTAGMGPDQLAGGQLSVDLGELTLDEPYTYSASVHTGRLEVFLPDDVPVRIDASVNNGLLIVDGREDQVGSHLEYTQQPPREAGGPVLTLDLDVHHGQLEVQR